MKNIDVLVVGELNVDIILDQIDGLPEVGKEKIAEELTVTLGSSSAIFASNLSTLGANVSFLGKIGTDNHAKIVKTSLEERGVKTNHIIETPDHKTGLTIVMNYDMDRANITYPGAMNYLVEPEITDNILQQAKHLHVSSVFMQLALKSDIVNLFKRAKAIGLTTSLDPQWDPSEKWELDLEVLLPLVDVFLPNAKEFQFITKTNSILSGLEKVKNFANIIAIKDGEHGAHLWKNQKMTSKSAFFNPKVADCIGAGDSFDAGFISKYINGENLSECLIFGNIAGAINTTKSGGTTAFESLEKFKSVAKEQFYINL